MIPLNTLATPPEVQDQIRTKAKARRIALRLTQQALSDRSGVAIATLKRFEQTGDASLTTLLALAEALEALDGFQELFPVPDTATLDELEAQSRPKTPQRVRKGTDGS